MQIGLIGMSAKPLTLGHFSLIELASNECDKTYVFVSTSDRKRPGEIPILGSTMHKIWQEEIEPIIPNNVIIDYGGVPIRKVYEMLGKASEAGNDNEDTFIIYSDPEDIEGNYPEKNRLKYFSNLVKNNQVEFRPVERSLTGGISGTKMRQYLASNDMSSFIKGLPSGVNGEHIWQLLKQDINENMILRNYIKLLIS